jgi:AcrR family transcriptional regulator
VLIMPRPVDHDRRRQLLDAAVDYVIEHGLAGLSLRPLAAALGTDAPVLLHHFGSKDRLLVAVLNGVRDRLRAVDAVVAEDDPVGRVRAVWAWAADPAHDRLYRLFFEAYAVALRRPDRYRDFLDHVVADWLAQLTPAVSERQATLVIATLRGLLLDLLATGDRTRVEGALQEYAATLAT